MRNVSLIALVALLSVMVASAQSREEKAVAAAVERLRQAMLDGDRTALESLTAAELSYGHSSGLIEDKKTFVDALVTGKSDFKEINLTNQTIKVAGNVAIVRHEMHGESNTGPVNIGILLVWQGKGDNWKLVARQAYKL
ncbi:MAG: nuclear transport factor 2 family protein [Cyclobacteriaceae bacterium]|jgi:ketosteroid isomerase-like protein|nr:nuclear transport factor 2 family protein [Cyclobacteriaceae bacterium]